MLLAGCVTTPETGRSAFIVTSEQEENQMGREAYAQILAKEKESTDVRLKNMLQRVGSRIAKASNHPEYKWEFKLIESKEANAFCLPGGKVAVYTGILPYARNEAGLAAVLGHEVAHATARHGGQRITMALGTQVGLAALQEIIGGKPSTQKNLLFAALGVGAQVGAVLPFSRGNESEADEIGLIYMARAGYDPREAPAFWARFAKLSEGAPPKWLSTHPPSNERQQALQNQIPKVMPEYERSPKYGAGEAL